MSKATIRLFERFYFSNRAFTSGTAEFHELCKQHIRRGSQILECGAGPDNPTSAFLTSLGTVIGADVSEEVLGNSSLSKAVVYEGSTLPFQDASFDACVSNYVIEHVANPHDHFREVARVLRPGGVYLFRTPNLLHYVALGSRMLPFRIHKALGKSLRGLGDSDHDPWVTHYRANTERALLRLSSKSGLLVRELRFVEKEPSYGRSSVILFTIMMAYERVVNMSSLLRHFRANIFAVLERPSLP